MFSKAWKQELLEKPQAKPAVSEGVVLPFGSRQQTTMLEPYGMLRHVTRHFFSDGDGLWGEHNPHFGKQSQGDARW